MRPNPTIASCIVRSIRPGTRAAASLTERNGSHTERAPVAGDALAEDLAALKLAQHLFSANLKVLRTHDRMLGTLLVVEA
jgi:flagellar hook-associated protein FlgK